MPIEERAAIVKELACVDEVIAFNDDDDTACAAIMQILQTKGSQWKLIFANGGDRVNTNTPEHQTYSDHPDVEFQWKVGGSNKRNSSSWILEEWKSPKTVRPWGWYRVLDEQPGYKIKELVIEPGKSLSDQKHQHRSEHWYVLKGEVTLETEWLAKKDVFKIRELTGGYVIGKNVWHKASNNTAYPCHVLEIQYGEKCIEEDIERRNR